MSKWYALLLSLISIFFLPVPVHAVDLTSATQSAELSVSATVKPRPVDFDFTLSADAGETVTANQEITYTISYGSKLDVIAPLKIEAQWSAGSIAGQYLFAYNILSYIPGSASKDYLGTTVPIVDNTQKKITWIIKKFPGNTTEKFLTFRLKTPGAYVTDQNIDFSIKARLETDGIAVKDAQLTQIYTPKEFILNEVRGMHLLTSEIRRIADTTFSLFLRANVPVRTTIYYGTTPDVEQTKIDATLSDTKTISIDGLTPATTYYFTILIENANGIRKKTPELFTVTTSTHNLSEQINQENVFISAQGVSFKDPFGQNSSVLVPSQKSMDVYLPFRLNPPVRAYLSLLHTRVLGMSSDEPPPLQKIRLLETNPGIFTGTIKASHTAGSYDLMLETQDSDGSISQNVLTTLVVSDPIMVVDDKGRPIEKALVYLEWLNEKSGVFEYFPAESFGSGNPSYTESDGTIGAILPRGTYSIQAQAIGYESYSGTFSLSSPGNHRYPKITLTAHPFSVRNYASYYFSVVMDGIALFDDGFDHLTRSFRFVDLGLLLGSFLLACMSLILNLHRIKLSFEGLYIYLEKHVMRSKRHDQIRSYIAFLENSTNNFPIHAATVILTQRDTKTVIDKDITSHFGEFRLHLPDTGTYDLTIKKAGFATIRETVSADHPNRRSFPMDRELFTSLPAWIEFILALGRSLTHAVSDTLLVVIIIVNTLLIYRLGIRQVIPIAIVTALNVVLWLDFQYLHWHLKRVK